MKNAPTGCWKKFRWPGGILLLGIGWVGLQLTSETVLDSGFAVNAPVLADEEPFQEGLQAGDAEEEGEYTVRLNFFNSTWPSVFRKLAEETNSELVMKRAPAGRLTRADRNKYSRTDAVRLLNREIEPKGFRLLEQGNFLVVLHLDSLRTRYQRPSVPASQPDEPRQAKAAEQVATPARKPFPNTERSDGFRKPLVRTGSRDDFPPTPRLHQPVESSDEPAGRRAVSSPQSPTVQSATLLSPVTVPTRRRGAKAVAQVIYAALKDRAELIHDGPGHLPAFQVFHKQTARRTKRAPNSPSVQFAVGIDTDREQLVVAGTRDQQRNIVQLIRTIDAVERGSGRAIRLVASEKDMRRSTQELRPVLKMMLAQNTNNRAQGFGPQPADANPKANAGPNQAGDQPNAGNQPQGQLGANAPQGGDPLLSVEALHGPVNINVIPGVGTVITGDPRDVEAVVQLLRQLEQLAVGVVPKMELLPLKHVNSEALAALLSTVYEQLTEVRGTTQQSQAAIIPVVRPNAILIIASKAVAGEIGELAIDLDQPINPSNEFQVFALKHAIATQVVETLDTMYPEQQQQGQQQPAGGLSARVRAVADVRTNSVIVQASPGDLIEVAALIRKIDRDASPAVSRLKVFPLKNAIADELVEVINESIQSVLSPAQTTGAQGGGQGGGAGQSTQQLSDAKSVVLEFLTNDGDARRIIRSGILADIRVTADPRVNSLIVSAPETSMPLMAELIKQLDLPTSNVAEIKVFELTNSDASGMAELLETLFASDDAQNQLGVNVAGAEDASSGLIPLRFSVDVRTNTIIAIGGAEALRVVEAILLRLDESDIRQRKNKIIKLKNSPADAVADAINRFLEAQGDLAQIDPELVSNVELLEQEIIVEPELVSNSLLLSATPRYFDEIEEMIHQLDEAPAQVIIQVLILEVLLDNTDEFGVELGFQDSLLFNRGLLNQETFQTITNTTTSPNGTQTTTEQIINQEGLPGFLFNNAQLGNNTAIQPASVGQQGLSNFSLGRINGDLGFGGLVLSASSESVSVLVRALASQRNVQILSRPQIRTVDNQLASIQVGQQVPVITAAPTNNLGGVTPTLGEPQQVGIILQVTPRITPDGTIVMETIANKSAIAGQGVPLITDPTTGAVVESPIFDITEAQATIAVPDGQTVVLGGMITQLDDTVERKVPWLGDIPLLGTAFRYDSTKSRRTELLIFMTPRIIRNAADSELIKQVEAERLHYVEEVAEEVHGPIFAVPADGPYNNLPGSLTIPPGDFPAGEDDVPTTIMPGNVPPLPGPSSSFNQFPAGMPIDGNAVGRQSVQSMNQQTVRGSVPKRKKWYRRLPFLPKSK
ncbi:MAG: hypothetical protein HON53_15795 [Planctomycetaceae bacterium]|nr:hypothetical protein [Planctomycetaceae bacterium]MBT6155851.1 hypothetical protein [Planctomycetaceae bacterium]MBT6484237.1 hypothetical protein [Planctomycetaceae bacterium]MBT6493186.1 hypothetical protein [Planctomycetaceae bacterium]